MSSPGHADRLRFHVSLDPSGATRVTPGRHDFPEASVRKNPFATVNVSQVTIPIWRTRWRDKKRRKTYVAYTIAWRDQLGRHREKRSSLAAAKSRAQEIATAINNGDIALLQFSHADRASLQRAREILSTLVGRVTPCAPPSLEVACGIYTQCVQILRGRCTPDEAARHWNATHPEGLVTKDAPDLVTEYLARRKMGAKWRRNLKTMLERFSKHFTGPLDTLTARDLDTWLDSLSLGRHGVPALAGQAVCLRTRRNYLRAIQSLCTYAKAQQYLSRDWSELKHVQDPEPDTAAVNLYTPDELVRLLNKAESYAAGRKLVPLIAITAFAGVRHGEMNEEKIEHLDWSHVDFDEKQIYIEKASSKTNRDRTVDMPDNLAAWLLPYRRPAGKICSLKNTSNALCRLRTKAGITGAKKNALRKSFVTYKKALTQSIEAVADQAGNSPGTIRKYYLQVAKRHRAAAERWFTLMPLRADVLPLFAWSRRPAAS